MVTNCVCPAASRGQRIPASNRRGKRSREPLGDVQFPEVLIEIDGLTRFSWILLGRAPRSEQELVTLYAALMGLGSDLSAAELVRMVPALAADSLGQMMLKIEVERRLRAANDAVLRFMREHRVATLLGARAVRLGRHDEPGGNALSLVGTDRS